VGSYDQDWENSVPHISHSMPWTTKVRQFADSSCQQTLINESGLAEHSPVSKFIFVGLVAISKPNTSMSFWRGRQMGWGLSASAAPCAQVSSTAQTALETLSGVNSAFYPAISSYPSTGFRNGQANIFPSLPSLNKVHHIPWTPWPTLPRT